MNQWQNEDKYRALFNFMEHGVFYQQADGTKDTGAGMDDYVKKHIFEPFFTTKATGKGAGMGLAAVYGTINNHMGKIEFESQKNRGTAFTIHLPVVSTQPPCTKGDVPSKSASPQSHILLVDDEEIMREVGERMLSKRGYTVTFACNGLTAVEKYKKSWKQIDLVIMDVIMPQMDGNEALSLMKEINPNAKIILTTGYSIDSDAQSKSNKKANRFLQKPFRARDLSHAIDQVLSSH